jgi:cytochrome o ubiquinol oxidase operon protein cyoD
MSQERSLKEIQKDWPQTFGLYIQGFIFCLILTAISFSLAALKLFSPWVSIFILVALAILQAVVQLVFFMHLGKESKPRWKLLVFYFMILILVVVVMGSLWIISDLNYRVMPDMSNMPM